MGNQNTDSSKQAEFDQTDIFDRLQHEFDALVSNNEPDVSPMQHTVDESAAMTEPLLTAARPDDTTQAVPGLLLPATKNPSSPPARPLILTGLAAAMLIAAGAAYFWTQNEPATPLTSADGQAADHSHPDRSHPAHSQQTIMKPADTAVNHLSVTPSDSTSASKQSTAHTAEHTAAFAIAEKRQAPMQTGSGSKNSPSPTARHSNWIINLESFHAQKDASAYIARLAQHGIHADMIAVHIRGRPWYRVRITGYASKQDAEKQRRILGKTLNMNSAWISKSR